ncbi:hypothetical protein MBM_04004 [Drepanopeziza brunnea f. sp. 'multigermtubi' MB_m1]|uniref:Uncharacterized protein n=1 Tax=Marssonina brunnea f. sp. multigermtubi (strain MB_m1) TaxID=1072389 RepID=K1WJ36_MARBU|nr:uncharacterized protein MBM_04004 [Drepanopeziza brunnea f. sp. 'multigermtubi' MB_m1]EKD17635.1 hypothetical protein MBM_04004 [Drepanopeziza brunnea f. sp. 'multigermtubi' MB_m1]
MLSICFRCVSHASRTIDNAASRCIFSADKSIKCKRCRAIKSTCILLLAKVVNAGIVLINAMTAINNRTKTADDVFRKSTVANNFFIKTRRAFAFRVSDASSFLRARVAAASFAAVNTRSPLASLSLVSALRLLAAAATADPASLDLLRQILAAVDRNNTLLSNFFSRQKSFAEVLAKLLIAAIPVVPFREVLAVTILVVLRKVRVVATSVRLRKVRAVLKVLRRALAPFHLALSCEVERVFIACRQLAK